MRLPKASWWCGLCAAVVFLAGVAHAAEAEHGGGGSVSPFAGDLGNAIWTLLIFMILLVVLGKFAWGPILAVLQKREGFIRDSLSSAKHEREEAERVLKQYTEQINRAREEATAIVDEARRDAETVRKRIQAEAKAEAVAMIARAKTEIGIARDDAVKALYDRTVDLATHVAAKIVRKELSPADHHRLLEDALEELGRVASRNRN